MWSIEQAQGQQIARTRWGTHESGSAFDRKKKSYLTEQASEFMASQSFCIIAGLNVQDELGALIMAGKPGFAQAIDERSCCITLSEPLQAARLVDRLLESSAIRRVDRLGLFFISHTTRERLCVHGSAIVLPGSTTRIVVQVRQSFFHCSKYIKTRVPGLTAQAVRAKAWSPEQILSVRNDYLTDVIGAYLMEHMLCFLCTIDRENQPAVNHRGGSPGFLVPITPGEVYPRGGVLLPDYAGNGAFEAIGNIFETGKAVLLVPDYGTQLAVNLCGSAAVLEMDELPFELQNRCTGAERVVALSIERIEVQRGNWSAALERERGRIHHIQTHEDWTNTCQVD
ncbi:MAG TPA: pyridoxamine 5'-phosphate oxidase family protein [Ktedonobacteraceae bacterium]|jgi:hypothetical protein|nr:pyridoxamine 5'-phosphate oxidase family protein [Ktedonobacteraceae bacterium]